MPEQGKGKRTSKVSLGRASVAVISVSSERFLISKGLVRFQIDISCRADEIVVVQDEMKQA